MPLLSQLRGDGGAVERAQHPDLHELPHAGAKGQSKVGASSGELEDGRPNRLGVDPSHGRLRLLQSRGACEPGHPHSMGWCLECHRHPENFLRPEDQVFNLDWKPDDVKPAEFVAKYGKPQGVTEDWSKRKTLSQSEIGQTLKERWNITPPQNCQGCHR